MGVLDIILVSQQTEGFNLYLISTVISVKATDNVKSRQDTNTHNRPDESWITCRNVPAEKFEVSGKALLCYATFVNL